MSDVIFFFLFCFPLFTVFTIDGLVRCIFDIWCHYHWIHTDHIEQMLFLSFLFPYGECVEWKLHKSCVMYRYVTASDTQLMILCKQNKVNLLNVQMQCYICIEPVSMTTTQIGIIWNMLKTGFRTKTYIQQNLQCHHRLNSSYDAVAERDEYSLNTQNMPYGGVTYKKIYVQKMYLLWSQMHRTSDLPHDFSRNTLWIRFCFYSAFFLHS